MASSKPRQGSQVLTSEVIRSSIGLGRRPRGKTEDGSWRPDVPFSSSDGLKITMRRAQGLTRPGVLEVPLRFQVPVLNEFRRPYRFNWSTLDTVSGGQRSRPMGRQLLEIAVDTMLMDRLAAEASSGVVVWDGEADPQRLINELLFVAGLGKERRGRPAPFRLVINQPAVWDDPVVSMVAVLTNVEPAQQSGSIATEALSMTFLEYPDGELDGQRTRVEDPRKHFLTGDDLPDGSNASLYNLAIRYLHQASAWRLIAKANGITGVSPNDGKELYAWARRHHKFTLTMPRTELQGRVTDAPTLADPLPRGLGR